MEVMIAVAIVAFISAILGGSMVRQMEAKELLAQNRTSLDRIAEALLERETLEGAELLLLIKGEPLPPLRAPVAPKPGPPSGRVKAEPSKNFPGEKLPDPEPVPG